MTGVDHLLRAPRGRSQQPLRAMDATKLRVEKRPFEVHAETARAVRLVFLERVRGLDDLGSRVQHRLPRCGHDAGDEAGDADARVLARGDRHGIALISVEEVLAGAVGVNVDQAGCDDAARRKRNAGFAFSRKECVDTTFRDANTPEGRRTVADRDERGAQRESHARAFATPGGSPTASESERALRRGGAP